MGKEDQPYLEIKKGKTNDTSLSGEKRNVQSLLI